jgi:MFS superfamily sulfate permease-like transporter
VSSVDDRYEPAPYDPVAESRRNTVEALAGFFAAVSLFASLVALAYHPVPLAVAAALLALVASGMSSRHKLLCFSAVIVAGACFVIGVVVAITTGHPLW